MRILIIVQNYPPECGPVRYSHDLAVALAERGHDVTVLTGLPHYPTGTPYPNFGRYRPVVRYEEGVRIIRTPLLMASNRETFRRMLGFFTFAASAVPWIMSLPRPDVVIASVPPLTVAPLGLLTARIRRAPLVMMLRDMEPLISFRLRGWLTKKPFQWVVQSALDIYRRARKIVVLHDSLRDTLLQFGFSADDIETIPHGVPFRRFGEEDGRPIPFALPRRPDRHLALYLGSFGVVHDLPSLVRAFASPAVRELPVDLVMVGDGEQKEECRNLIHRYGLSNVTMLPPVPLDLLVCAYLTRNDYAPDMLGAKFYEYCAAAKPLLISGYGYAAKLVETIGNGWACRPNDEQSVAAALRQYLAAADASVAIGARGRAFIEKHHDSAGNFNRWEQLLQTLSARPSQQRSDARKA
jgi:glycosyltransferase involved in cell wall biosynthesis